LIKFSPKINPQFIFYFSKFFDSGANHNGILLLSSAYPAEESKTKISKYFHFKEQPEDI